MGLINEVNVEYTTVTSGGIPAGSKNKYLKYNAAGEVVPCTAATDRAVYVMPDDHEIRQGERFSAKSGGLVTVLAGAGGFKSGDVVGTDANGAAVPITVAGNWCCGIVDIGAAAGQYGRVRLAHFTA